MGVILRGTNLILSFDCDGVLFVVKLRRSIRSLAESIDSFTLHSDGFVLHSDGSHSSIVLTPSYAAISIAVVLTFNRTDSLLTESIRSLAIIYQFVLHSDGSHSSIVLTRSYAALSIAIVLTFNRTDSFSLSIDSSSVAYKIGEKKNDPLAMYASDIMTSLIKKLAMLFVMGLKSVIKEGYKSFPSGHTSWKEEKLVALSQIGGPVPLAS
ncbi:lipid phosphate phosphatase [Trifolium repens]|nr:lipid phosphate phosphatase [Trifolium repens]